MNSQQWQLVKELFEPALQCDAAERCAFLERACSGDDELRRELESLLAAHESDTEFMNTPACVLLVSNEPLLTTGRNLGHYEPISQLGAGGMGEVYLAMDTRLSRKVALKVLPSIYTNDPHRVHRFEQEARAASALNHPNIVTIHEIGQFESLHFIATEFVDGVTLREHMSNTRMTVGEVLDVTVQLASALQAAHDAGIVHRDIKPENLMLRPDGIVKVLDFGLAKLAPQQQSPIASEARTKLAINTNPGLVMGTVSYMSPEQARGREVDARTDIWSLGVVLYELVAGRAPFIGETQSHVIVSILEKEPLTVSRSADVPPELLQIIARTLRKDKLERYQTAADVATDLKNLKEELTIESRLKLLRAQHDLEAAANTDPGAMETGDNPAATTADVATMRKSFAFVDRIGRHKAVAALALLLFVISAIAWTYFSISRNKAAANVGPKKSIAILPFKPIDATRNDDVYEIGIADALIHRLSSMNGFAVRPLTATREYKGDAQDPIDTGTELQVDYILASNYQLADGKIRVTAQLLNVASGQIEQTYKIERDASNVFAMQDEIATEVENKLLARFATTSNQLATKRGTTNEEAYRLYLQGMYLANNRNLSDARKAIEQLERAVELDSNYARAWAGLAYTHRTISLWTSNQSTTETYQKSIAAINKALALDPNLSEAHSALCENKFLFEWDFAGAEQECKRAIELDPTSTQAREIFSRYLMGRGRIDEAIAEIQTAIDLEPTSRFYQKIYGRALFYARRYSEAVAQFKRVVTNDPATPGNYSWLSTALAFDGNESEAFVWFEKLLSLQKMNETDVQIFKTAFQTAGWRGVLREWLKRFEKVGGTTFDRALYNAQVGEKDHAFDYLEKVYQRREVWVTYLRVEPRLDPLRDDPRFGELIRRVEGK